MRDKSLYGIVDQEFQNGSIDRALWTKALADSDGQEDRTRARYIRLRVNELKTERAQERYQVRKQEKTREKQERPARRAVDATIWIGHISLLFAAFQPDVLHQNVVAGLTVTGVIALLSYYLAIGIFASHGLVCRRYFHRLVFG